MAANDKSTARIEPSLSTVLPEASAKRPTMLESQAAMVAMVMIPSL